MSAATISPAPVRPPTGATAVDGSHHHPLGNALRAVKVFVEAAFSVVILGEYGEEAGIHHK
ncbi:hypothetical protein J2Z21_005560 [Streptomyces griseochromogenes]|uniref:Uncharacterized protein n=1 Tax=Streptomyces griseochromogenes TaxID=68214 RepID=A0A1B1BAM4_9ACTN|nr:hypothetical protein [Streptomyces griseochromogenes]ANP55782.1 hypothetical protein AVL59_44800 [Streptomyces griseochromogenes]MBP2052573.1 hypothetical protein [Streptomyces griseochromogenes]